MVFKKTKYETLVGQVTNRKVSEDGGRANFKIGGKAATVFAERNIYDDDGDVSGKEPNAAWDVVKAAAKDGTPLEVEVSVKAKSDSDGFWYTVVKAKRSEAAPVPAGEAAQRPTDPFMVIFARGAIPAISMAILAETTGVEISEALIAKAREIMFGAMGLATEGVVRKEDVDEARRIIAAKAKIAPKAEAKVEEEADESEDPA